jgi:WD40 repeat protein
MLMRVYNYNTMAKIKTFEGHTDYIRCIAVHPTQPLVLTSSDDMLIKLWNWDKQWQCVQVFEGHSHYVMMVAFNPKDTNTFASASLDRTIRVRPNCQLHSRFFAKIIANVSHSLFFRSGAWVMVLLTTHWKDTIVV